MHVLAISCKTDFVARLSMSVLKDLSSTWGYIQDRARD